MSADSVPPLRLPRSVEGELVATDLVEQIHQRGRPLWPGGTCQVPHADLAPPLAAALTSAYSAGRIVRGLEEAGRTLAAEERGLRHVDQKTGVARGERISRLLIVANDGAERFYRGVDSLLRGYGPRVLAIQVSAGEEELGALLFGPDKVARLLMVQHKEAVAAVLIALADQWNPAVSES